MRAALWLSGLLLLVPRPALAQPMPTGCSIECPADSAHPGLELHFPADAEACHADESVIQCRCYDRCGDDSGGGGGGYSGSSTTQQQTQDIPPILTAAVTLVVLAIAPVFTIEFKRNPADIRAEVLRARADWTNYRDTYRDVVAFGERWSAQRYREQRQSAALQRDLHAAAQPVKKPPDYQWIAPAPANRPPSRKPWGESGFCTDLIRASDRLVATASRDANRAALEAALPETAQLLHDPGAAARDQLLGSVGAEEYAKRARKLKQAYDEADKWSGLMTTLRDCLNRVPPTRDIEQAKKINTCLAPLLSAEVPDALWSQLTKLAGKGTDEALERVRKFASFYVGYVHRLQLQTTQMALAATRCR